MHPIATTMPRYNGQKEAETEVYIQEGLTGIANETYASAHEGTMVPMPCFTGD